MAGPDANTLIPTDVKLHQASRVLELVFADGRRFRLPYEFLRVSSPSAEVRGHGPGQETLQTGKREVTITAIEPVGHYAWSHISMATDRHLPWEYLYDLCERQDTLWRDYLAPAAANASREQ